MPARVAALLVACVLAVACGGDAAMPATPAVTPPASSTPSVPATTPTGPAVTPSGTVGATEAPTQPGTADGECVDGSVLVDGVQALNYCGPARAEGILNGQAFAVTPGRCAFTDDAVSVSLGTYLIGEDVGVPDYFALLVGSAGMDGPDEVAASTDGTYDADGLFVAVGGTLYSAYPVTVTLTDNRSRGEFSGPLDIGEGEISGSWTCD